MPPPFPCSSIHFTIIFCKGSAPRLLSRGGGGNHIVSFDVNKARQCCVFQHYKYFLYYILLLVFGILKEKKHNKNSLITFFLICQVWKKIHQNFKWHTCMFIREMGHFRPNLHIIINPVFSTSRRRLGLLYKVKLDFAFWWSYKGVSLLANHLQRLLTTRNGFWWDSKPLKNPIKVTW